MIIKPMKKSQAAILWLGYSSVFLQKCSKSVAKITILLDDLGQFTLTWFLCLKNKVTGITCKGAL